MLPFAVQPHETGTLCCSKAYICFEHSCAWSAEDNTRPDTQDFMSQKLSTQPFHSFSSPSPSSSSCRQVTSQKVKPWRATNTTTRHHKPRHCAHKTTKKAAHLAVLLHTLSPRRSAFLLRRQIHFLLRRRGLFLSRPSTLLHVRHLRILAIVPLRVPARLRTATTQHKSPGACATS